mgnify:CR=1 FL=1
MGAATAAGSAITDVTGLAIGTIQRRYGLLASEEVLVVAQAFDRCSDLAVADRTAWMYATELRCQVVVFEYDGWYWVSQLASTIAPEQVRDLRPIGELPRMLSIAGERGILPLVGPLAMAAG